MLTRGGQRVGGGVGVGGCASEVEGTRIGRIVCRLAGVHGMLEIIGILDSMGGRGIRIRIRIRWRRFGGAGGSCGRPSKEFTLRSKPISEGAWPGPTRNPYLARDYALPSVPTPAHAIDSYRVCLARANRTTHS